MSIVFNGSSQCAFRATAPSASDFLVAGWFRRNTDSGATEVWLDVSDGTGVNETVAYVSSSDLLGVYASNYGLTQPYVNPLTTSTWYWVMWRYTGGTLTSRHCADGDTAWQSNNSNGSLANLVPNSVTIGAQRGNNTPLSWAPATSALVRIYSGVTLPNDTEALAERLSITPTVTTGLWANYPFATGDLGNDDTVNARDLTLTGTPTYTAAAPTDLAYGASGPTITTQPVAGLVILNETEFAAKTLTTAATSSGGARAYTLQEETAVASAAYADVTTGGIYGSATAGDVASISSTLTPTNTSKNGLRYRHKVTDSNGTTYSTAVLFNVYTGAVITTQPGVTNASGAFSGGVVTPATVALSTFAGQDGGETGGWFQRIANTVDSTALAVTSFQSAVGRLADNGAYRLADNGARRLS